MSLRALRAACGGFLLAVLWFDLMFDVQVLGHGAAPSPLPDETLASIARYYARVTGGAHPMQVLVALVMATAVLASLWNVRRSPQAARAWITLLLVAAPVGLAAWRVVPNAMRLGTRSDSIVEQSRLARSIFADHVFCWLAIAIFTILQVTRRSSPGRSGPRAAAPR